MKHQFIYAFLFLSALWLISCDRPQCTNENPVFSSNEPGSKVYKDELAKQLKSIDEGELSYWLQKYEEEDGIESLYFNIQGGGLCAVLQLSVDQWDKLENVRDKKGIGYRGAEFTNLKFTVEQDAQSTSFNYVTFDRIID